MQSDREEGKRIIGTLLRSTRFQWRRRAAAPCLPGCPRFMPTRLSLRDLLLTLAVVSLWGFAFVPIKWALVEVPPFRSPRCASCSPRCPLCSWCARPRVPGAASIGYGLAIGVLQFGLMFLGMHLGMPAGLSSLVMQLQVFFTIALAVAFAGDRLHRWNTHRRAHRLRGHGRAGRLQAGRRAHRHLRGLRRADCGRAGLGRGQPHREALGTARTCSRWSSGRASCRRRSSRRSRTPSRAARRRFAALAQASAGTWIAIAFLAWGATLFGFSSWNRLLHRYPAPLISPFALLIPISGLASGALFLGERLAPLQALGVVLVLAGLAVNVQARAAAGLARRCCGARREPPER